MEPLKVSVVVPVYNEERYIERIIRRVMSSSLGESGARLEVVVVDDHSHDGTFGVLERLQEELDIEVFRHERNQGKGAALRTGFQAVTGSIVIIQDADLEYDPAEYGRLLEPILNNKADVVYGSRFMGVGPHRVLYFWHYVANRLLTLFSNMFTDLNLSDMETCYKAFRAQILDSIRVEEDRFGFEPEFTAKVAKLARREGIRIYEIGISYSGRTYEEGKKIKWTDAVSAFRCILKYNLLR